MKYGIFAVASAFALAACGGGAVDADADGDGAITMDEAKAAAEEAGAVMKPEPGKYKSTMTFIEADIPGIPDQAKAMMGSQMSFSNEFCISPEMAEDGFEEAVKRGQRGECDISKYELNGNEMAMEMTCTPPEGGEVNVVVNGTVSPTKSETNVSAKINIPQMGSGSVKMSMLQERVGDCE